MLSFIVPVYNTKEYLPKCIDSILSSGVEDYEIILVDDGSTDGSDAVCREYQDMHPDRFRFIKKKNGGASSARNAGLDVADGEYIMFVDSDDRLFRGGSAVSGLKMILTSCCSGFLWQMRLGIWMAGEVFAKSTG